MKKEDARKQLLIRMPKDTWHYLKRTAVEHETSMSRIIELCVKKYKKDLQNVLTDK